MTVAQDLCLDNSQDKMAAIFRKRASDLAGDRIRKSKQNSDIPVLVFWVGNERYALELGDLSGVFPCDNCTPLPKSDKVIFGVINIRGDLHCVLELSGLLGLDLPRGDEKSYVLLLKQTGLGLNVHRLDQILYFREEDRTGSAQLHYEIPAEYGKAVFQETIILLNLPKILTHPVLVKK
ncbi:MAG: chemotaxis protein CheW [Desulfobacula sp.]|jgi:purine-binding chemotaxis protein CheW